MKRWLVDTGPLVAYLNPRDPAHEAVAAAIQPFTGSFVTTSAVLTEAMHFLAATPQGPALVAELVVASRTDVRDLSRPPELEEVVGLMEKYADVPMDFADATLVLLAELLDVHDVLTLDCRGFSAFRTRDDRPLRMVLDFESS